VSGDGITARVRVEHGDSREVLKTLAAESVDSCVCDPPYALVSIARRFGADGAAPARSGGATGVYARASAGFMGQKWDTGETAFDPAFWREVWRVLKPGAHVVAFGGARTYHRLAVAIEDAGFEIRDMFADLVASDAAAAAFRDSLNDEQARQFLRCIEESRFGGMLAWIYGSGFPKSHDVSRGIDKAAGAQRRVVRERYTARRINPGATNHRNGGYAKQTATFTAAETAPATEAAAQWSGWGTALKPALEPIVLARKPLTGTVVETVLAHGTGAINVEGCRIDAPDGVLRVAHFETGARRGYDGGLKGGATAGFGDSRWPANVVHDGSDEVVEGFPEAGSGAAGSAARFFYSAKADAADRHGSKHPTVKPVDLMAWLVRLVTPKGGVVLDPFAGSGTTGIAAWREGCRAILIEREAEYVADIKRRLAWSDGEGRLTALETARSIEPETARGEGLPLFGGGARP